MKLIRLLPVLFVILGSCELYDDRDLCCSRDTLRFRYYYRGQDRFFQCIDNVRYFLFKGDGEYVDQLESKEDSPNKICISGLLPGPYSVVAVCNLDDYGVMEGYEAEGLDAFRLRVNQFYEPYTVSETMPTSAFPFRSGDPLYWGECDFIVGEGANVFLGELSNVHCMLTVRVEWENMPDHHSGYSYSLEGVGTGMPLNTNNVQTLDIHRFPQVERYIGSVKHDVQMHDMSLTSTIITLRWTDDDMPTFRLLHDGEAVTKPIDLKWVFGKWGWHPSTDHVQDYKIRLLIRKDHGIDIFQGIDASIGDWIDGGSIG